MYGELLGTHPNCFISWENVVVEKFFFYNTGTLMMTLYFETVILFNVLRVQSHNQETVMYLKDQVKGLLVTSFLMVILWGYKMMGWLSYYKDPTVDLANPAPLFQIFNGWFGVIMFFTLGMWSKRFRIGLRSQAEEKKRLMQEKTGKLKGNSGEEYAQDDENPLGSPEDGASPVASSPTSPAASRPVLAQPSRPSSSQASRPATAGATGTSRPASAAPDPEDVPEEDSPPVDEETPEKPEPVVDDEPAEV